VALAELPADSPAARERALRAALTAPDVVLLMRSLSILIQGMESDDAGASTRPFALIVEVLARSDSSCRLMPASAAATIACSLTRLHGKVSQVSSTKSATNQSP
jgi:hypothetical protein